MRDLCRCGHHRDTHFKNERGQPEACLGVHCDCRYYDNDENRHDTPVLPAINYADWPKRTNKPHVDTTCECKACQEWLYRKYLHGF